MIKVIELQVNGEEVMWRPGDGATWK